MLQPGVILGEYAALEPALWEEIERVQGGGPLARVTVLAPSGRLVRHLKCAAARRFPAGLSGVLFANLFQFALDLAGEGVRVVADRVFFERILLRWLETDGAERGLPGGPEESTWDVAGALHAAIRDLEDAAVPPDGALVVEALRAVAGTHGSRITELDVRKLGAVLVAYRDYRETLARLGVAGRALVFEAAAARADRVRTPLVVYGFYDLTQVQADLLVALGRHTAVRLLIPHGEDPATWRFGGWLRDTFAPTLGAGPPRRLSLPAPPPEPRIATAAGERDEVWYCARAVRALLDGGCAPTDIAVVARALEPYLAPLREFFAEHRIPAELPPASLLSEHPLAQAALLLFRAALDDHSRDAVLDVVCHPLFRAEGDRRHWALLARALRIGHGADWERLGRHARDGYTIVAGREDDDDRRELRVGAAEVRALGRAVRRLRALAWAERAGWGAHAAAHAAVLGRYFGRDGLLDQERRVLEGLADVLKSLARLDALGESVPRRTFVEAFERECRRRRLPEAGAQGVAVLDAMGARGLSFGHVFLLGVNARTFPRFIVEEPFVSDAVRREVIRVLGHHLPVRADGYDEERLLFHLVRGAAREGLVCLYQRADAQGRPREPSPFLRPLLAADRAVDRIPRSEGEKRRWPGVRTPREIELTAADPAGALAAFGHDADIYRRAERVLRALDRSPVVSAHEGRVGPLGRAGVRLSATRLETYAACPFRYFADEVLRLFPHEEHVGGDDLTPLEIGSLMHAVLEILYGDLAARGFDAAGLAGAVERAAGAAVAAFERRTGVVARGLLAVRVARICRAVEAYARWDLAHLGGWEPVAFEQRASAELGGVAVSGTIDRVDRHRTRGVVRVVDYKRRWRDGWKTGLATQARRGAKLQGPFYLELAARLGWGAVEEAAFHFVENHAAEDPSIDAVRRARMLSTLGAGDWQQCRSEVEHVIATLVDMIREGWFFIRPDDDRRGGRCRHCGFRSICRRNYGRLGRKPQGAPEAAAYWAIVDR